MHLEPKVLCRSPKTKIAMPIWPGLRFYFQSWFFQGYPGCANLSLGPTRAQSFSSHPGSAETARLHWGIWQGQEISAALKPCLNKASGSAPPELSGRPPWAARTPLNLSTIGAEPFDNRATPGMPENRATPGMPQIPLSKTTKVTCAVKAKVKGATTCKQPL